MGCRISTTLPRSISTVLTLSLKCRKLKIYIFRLFRPKKKFSKQCRILHRGSSLGAATSLIFIRFFILTRILETIWIYFSIFFLLLQKMYFETVLTFDIEVSVWAAVSINFDRFSILTSVGNALFYIFSNLFPGLLMLKSVCNIWSSF